MKKAVECSLWLLGAGIFLLGGLDARANVAEVYWESGGFSMSAITINVGDEVDIVNIDTASYLLVTGAPPQSFSAEIPPTDGVDYYYLPYVYNSPGIFAFSDQFGDTVTVTVNALVPLSVAITTPTNNAAFAAPANFTVTTVPSGGATPYAQVQFFLGNNAIGTASSSPFTNAVTNLAPGNYTLTAVVKDNSSATASNSITVSVLSAPVIHTNYILPSSCGSIYSSGSVSTLYLGTGNNIEGGLLFPAFNAAQYSSILLEINPYGLPLFGSNVSIYGFNSATGALAGSNYNAGTFLGVLTLPANPGYGQIITYDVTAFVKSASGPYLGFLLEGGAYTFSSLSYNYGTPPELFAISVLSPSLTTARSGSNTIISWGTNYSAGLLLESSASIGSNASWNMVSPAPILVRGQWVVTNSISNATRFFRLSNH